MKRTLALLAILALAACRPEAQAAFIRGNSLQSAVDAWRQRTPAPGVVAIVSQDGAADRIVVSGTQHRGGREAVTVDSQFRAASITKLLVATVLMQLEIENLLDLDDAASSHLSRRLPIDSMLDGVTVRHLLSHTSGLPDAGRSPELTDAVKEEPEHRWTVDEVLRIVEKRELEFPPGSRYDYSNTNYLVLGELIEGVTGRPWHTEIRERILDPVGMADSYLAGVEEATGPLTPGYFDLDNDGNTQQVPASWPALETSEGAAGSLVSTAPDLMRFMEAFAAGKLVPAAAVKQMTAPGPHASRHTGYGLGVEVRRPDLESWTWGHGGVVPGYRAVLWHVPSKKMSVAVLANESRSRPDGLAEILLRTAYPG